VWTSFKNSLCFLRKQHTKMSLMTILTHYLNMSSKCGSVSSKVSYIFLFLFFWRFLLPNLLIKVNSLLISGPNYPFWILKLLVLTLVLTISLMGTFTAFSIWIFPFTKKTWQFYLSFSFS
jgi:hypothetical protein